MLRRIVRRFSIMALLMAGLLTAAGDCAGPLPGASQAVPPATIRIDAARKLHRITPRFIGVNLEDLNSQCYGGLYSQLLYGESFQEHVDSAVLGLEGKDRLKVFVGENEKGQIELWGFRGRVWEHNAARETLGLPLRQRQPSSQLPLARVRGGKRARFLPLPAHRAIHRPPEPASFVRLRHRRTRHRQRRPEPVGHSPGGRKTV
jgi:hypothetical protein